jgi:Ca2+-binding RTX toxin-like protein
MNADGSNAVMLSDGFFDIFPGWSPDGTKIAFHSFRDDRVEFRNAEVYVMNADGSNEVNITNNFSADQRCDWQPLCTIYGSGTIVGTEGNDVICGSEGPDRISDGGGDDVVYGFGGDDQIGGGGGNDRIFGGLGNDTMDGGAGNDFTSGGPGNDRLAVGAGERVDTGAGSDQCVIGNVPSCPRLS